MTGTISIPHFREEEVEVHHLLYEDDGARRALPRNPELRGAGGEGVPAASAYLARLSGGGGLGFGISGLTPKPSRSRRRPPPKKADFHNYFSTLAFVDGH